MAQNSGKTAKRGPGRPFPKGKSGNPGGRPKQHQEIVELARIAAPDAIAKLIQLMDHRDPRVCLAACSVLLDRGYGKPGQAELPSADEEPQRFVLKLNLTDSNGNSVHYPESDDAASAGLL